MKDVLSAFSSDVLRPIVSLFIPGAISATPATCALLWRNEWLRRFLQPYHSEAIVAAILIVLFLGLLCEDWGSHLESWFDRKQNQPCTKLGKVREAGDHGRNWYEYLRIAYKIEPVGHHYLRTLVLRLKFELGSFAAFVVSLLGIWLLPTTASTRALISIVPLMFILVLYFEAKWTHELLSELRAELLKGITEWPVQTSAKAVDIGS
jgi:hypothetical protein